MKYQQPHGISDPNGPYINGNPSTGTMGSIPPAASIEFPQREIVNFIVDAGITPSDGDLHQLAKAVQSGQVIYGDDGGTANQVVITPFPPVLELRRGMIFIARVGTDNTGPATLKVNSLAPVPIVHVIDRSELNAGDLVQYALQAFAYDGTTFQMVWSMASGGGGGAVVFLQAPRTFYVNDSTGSDTYDGLTAAVGTGIHGPFKTIQKACDQIPLYNLNGHYITIYVANGNYAAFNAWPVNGSGSIRMYGNPGSPGSVVVNGSGKSAAIFSCGCPVYLDGIKVTTSGTPTAADPLSGITALLAGTQVACGNLELGNCAGEQMRAQRGGSLANLDPSSQWHVSASNALGFMIVTDRSSFERNGNGGPIITFSVVTYYSGAFLQCNLQSWTHLIWSNIGGYYGNVTGVRYTVGGNSTIATNGGGPNYYPGNIAGWADGSTGGAYV